jgi:hypothetical protein
LPSKSSPALFLYELMDVARITGNVVPAGTTNGAGGSGGCAGAFAGFAASACSCVGACTGACSCAVAGVVAGVCSTDCWGVAVWFEGVAAGAVAFCAEFVFDLPHPTSNTIPAISA